MIESALPTTAIESRIGIRVMPTQCSTLLVLAIDAVVGSRLEPPYALVSNLLY